MDKHNKKCTVSAFLISFILLSHWGCTQKRGEDEIYSGDYRPADLITIEQEEGYPDIQFPRNQLIIKAADGITRDQILAVLDEIGGSLIGQIPSRGLYQLKVNAADKDKLDQIKTALKARSEIARISYNPLCHQAGLPNDRCPVEPDNKVNLQNDPFEYSEYQITLEIIEGLRDVIPMRRVAIGLLERGYNATSNPEFEETPIRDVSEPDTPLDPTDTHGNAMMGIICADNDGSGVNGIASSFLKENLIVYIARPRNETVFSYQTALDNLTNVAEIIINSWFVTLSPASEEEYFDLFDMYNDIMWDSPWSLFVNAVPTENVLVTLRNSLPAAIVHDNTLTVSAHSGVDPYRKSVNAGYGDLVEISANGVVDVTSPSGSVTLQSGTCFAAAQVASAAALLKSVGGNRLDIREVKHLLLEATFGGQPVEPSAGILLTYSYPLADLLWEMYQNEPWAPYIMDFDFDDLHDTPIQIAESVCEETNVTVEEFGQFSFDPSTPCGTRPNAFLMATDGSSMHVGFIGVGQEPTMIAFRIGTVDPFPGLFALHEQYALGPDYPLNLGIDICTDKNRDCECETEAGDFKYAGSALLGTMEITRCSVLKRNNQGKPTALSVDLTFDCLLEGYMREWAEMAPELMSSTANGWIRSAAVIPITPLGFFDDSIDEMCSGEAEEEESE